MYTTVPRFLQFPSGVFTAQWAGHIFSVERTNMLMGADGERHRAPWHRWEITYHGEAEHFKKLTGHTTRSKQMAEWLINLSIVNYHSI